MMDLTGKSCVVFDHGLFLELALRLARDFGRVYYVDPLWEESFSKLNHAVIGDGYEEIERAKEIWDVIDKVDLAVFPDTHNSSMQEFLESRGMPVWGGRHADNLELKKLAFRKLQAELGMKFPEYETITGLGALRDYCRNPDNEDRWVKLTPQFRGHQETFHHIQYLLTRPILDEMGIEFGPLQDYLTFICEHPIKAKLEGGLDTYTVDGKHPATAIIGYESKDKCYFASVQPYDKIAPEITRVHEPLWPILKEYRCRQFLSSETKITDDGQSFLLEPTVRMPSPAGEEQMELYRNLSEIIFQGAKGELVEPDIAANYACEAMVAHTHNKDRWRTLKIPPSMRRWVKLYNTVCFGDVVGIPPGNDVIGAVVGIGDTPSAALEHLKEVAGSISDQPVKVHVEALATIINEIDESTKAGIKFGNESMPDPAQALSES